MSSFLPNLASLTLGTRGRLARLEASTGGVLCAHRHSPAPIAAAGATFTFPSPAVGGGAGLASSGLEGGADVSGEFLLSGAS
jgi:hypothetical protein